LIILLKRVQTLPNCVRDLISYLYRILAHAYIAYFEIINIGELCRERINKNTRRLALISEIKTINYAINTAKNSIAQLPIIRGSLHDFVRDISEKTPEQIMDKYYIHYKKRKPYNSYFKYSVEPGIDAKLLRVGTIMMGYNCVKKGENRKHNYSDEPFVVSLDDSNKKVWHAFSCHESNYTHYLKDKYMIDLYGQMYYDAIKKKINT